jgi:hypothetical protein
MRAVQDNPAPRPKDETGHRDGERKRRGSLDARSLAQPCYLPEEIHRPPEREEERDLRSAPPVKSRRASWEKTKRRERMQGQTVSRARRAPTMKRWSLDARTMGHPTPGSQDTRPPIGKRSKERNRWCSVAAHNFQQPYSFFPSRTSTQTSQKLTDCSIHYSD